VLRILHISDLHFDAVYGRYPEVVRSALKAGLNRAFANAVDYAIEKSVDLLLITGDLCDKGQVSYATESFLKKQFERLSLANIYVIALHGNHDPSSELNWNLKSEGINFVTKPESTTIEIPLKSGEKCYISANGFENKAESLSRIETFPIRSEGAYHVGAMHTFTASGLATGEHEPYMKTNLNELSSKKYDYWALGHIHKMQLWPSHKAAYSGSLQGLHANEIGEKGGILVDLEEPGAQPNLKFVDFSVLEFQSVYVDIQSESSSFETNSSVTLHDIKSKIIQEISKMKSQRKIRKSFLVRVMLEGASKYYDSLQKEGLKQELESDIREDAEVLFVEVNTDRLTPYVDKNEILKASPFASFIEEMLTSPELKQKLVEYAGSVSFAEKPDNETAWIEDLINQVGDEWLYKMVKHNENK